MSCVHVFIFVVFLSYFEKKFLTEDELRKKKRKKLSSTDSMDRPMLKRKKFNRDGYKV